MKHEAMQDIGEVDLALIFVPLPVRISQRFVDTGNSLASHLTTKMQKEVCEVFHKICYILGFMGYFSDYIIIKMLIVHRFVGVLLPTVVYSSVHCVGT